MTQMCFIYDAMYTDEEYHNPTSPKVGWGHSTWQEAIKMAEAAGVKRVVIFHHDPTHSDDMLDENCSRSPSQISQSDYGTGRFDFTGECIEPIWDL
jgi:phosphoribosyl 1,2-cyclic phosphodiesterase